MIFSGVFNHSLRPRKPTWIHGSLCVALLIVIWTSSVLASSSASIVIGSKNFLENRLLAEMFAQLIESHTALTVDRRFGLAGTQICFQALTTGAIDLYPEYTGTGLVTILDEPAMQDPSSVLNHVRHEFRKRWNLWWLTPLGFDNSYALALRRDRAKALNIRTITDLVGSAKKLKAAFGFEFIQRADGLPGLKNLYRLEFREVVGMQQSLKYEAADKGDVDLLDVYTTDGRLAVYDFVVLEDDQQFFPPYDAAALVRGETLKQHPDLAKVLSLLSNALSPERMRELNFRIQEQGETISQVAYDALHALHLVKETQEQTAAQTIKESTSFFSYMWKQRTMLSVRTGEHLWLAGIGLLLGIALALPLAFILERWRSGAETMIRIIGMSQTIPSIALLAFMIPLFGVGVLPAIMALWIYSLYPILRNTFSGLRDAAPSVVETGRALGMTEWQILRSVRLPLAAPTIMAGIRTSAIWTVGTATLAAFIGAGGLGVPIVSGLQLADVRVILSGALPVTILALMVDGLLGWIERFVRPRGLEVSR